VNGFRRIPELEMSCIGIIRWYRCRYDTGDAFAATVACYYDPEAKLTMRPPLSPVFRVENQRLGNCTSAMGP